MKTIKQKEEFFNKISESLEFHIMDYLHDDELEDINSYDELNDILRENYAFDVDIIYYHNAMKYLMEHDISLYQSMELASELGWQPKDINSELLASLLASDISQEDFYKLQSKIEEFFNN